MIPPPESSPLDIVTVAMIVITALAGGEVARIAGPYAVIVGSALVGAYIALTRRPEYTVVQSVAFALAVTVASVLITGTASVVAALLLGKVGIELQAYYLLAPISFGIAVVGPDWQAVAVWAAGMFRRRVERAVGGDQP